jgi:hypothetical protein
MDNKKIKKIKKESRIVNSGIRLITKVKPSKKLYIRKKDKRKLEEDFTLLTQDKICDYEMYLFSFLIF